MVKDPADYRFSSYGEAIGGGRKGNGKTARAGLVRALRAHKGQEADAGLWKDNVAREYRNLLRSGAAELTRETMNRQGVMENKVVRRGLTEEEIDAATGHDGDIPLGKALRCRIRYFTDGAVIGSRSFVNAAFRAARDRFGPNRKDGARKLRGSAAGLAGSIWSMRDLRTSIG